MQIKTLGLMIGFLFNPVAWANGLFIEVTTDVDRSKREKVYFEINGRETPKEYGTIAYPVTEDQSIEIVAIHDESNCRDVRRYDHIKDVPNRLRFRLRTCVLNWLDQLEVAYKSKWLREHPGQQPNW